MKNIIYALFFFSVSSYAGFGLETTRVVYHGNEAKTSFVAFNDSEASSGENFLIQSWVSDLTGKESDHFIMTPPIFKLSASEKNAINITKVANLPEDKESMYWINVRFISPEKKEGDSNPINYSFTNKIKLIYRPDVLLNESIDKQFKLISVKKNQDGFEIVNPTPFYININRVVFNGNDIENKGYILPNSSLALNKVKENGSVSIFFLNDLGAEIEYSYKL